MSMGNNMIIEEIIDKICDIKHEWMINYYSNKEPDYEIFMDYDIYRSICNEIKGFGQIPYHHYEFKSDDKIHGYPVYKVVGDFQGWRVHQKLS